MAAFQLFGYCVYCEHKKKCNDGFKHANCRGIRKHAVLDTIAEGIGVYNIGILSVQGITEQEILVKTGIKQASDGKNEQYQDGGPKQRKQDIPNLLQP